MIAYWSAEDALDPLAELRRLLAETAGAAPARVAVTDWLIDFGRLESAVADASEASGTQPGGGWRRGALAIGHALVHAADGRTGEARAAVHRFGGDLRRLARGPLPREVRAGTPEGYAWYALYPENYAAAARALHAALRPRDVAVVGLRSIGTSLSAVVAAQLEQLGARVRSWTARPSGHPFERQLALEAAMRRALAAEPPDVAAIVDEGPGLSGSSLASAAQALAQAGIDDSRIVFLPAWDAGGEAFVSARARERWRRHRRFVGGLHPLQVALGSAAGWRDISAGRWRELAPGGVAAEVAVQPQHERAKYVRDGELLKFAGLGRRGAAALARAAALADAGWSPPALGLEHGFLRSRWIDGHPLAAADGTNGMIEVAARYLAHLAREFPAAGRAGARADELLDMVRANAREALGERWAARADAFAALAAGCADAPRTAIDGRMLPHEWLRAGDGRLLKCDAVEHHAGHFLPGCQDIAWDLAGFAVEFGLPRNGAERLVERYEALSAERGLARRIRFHRLAYLAFRLGYCELAARAIPGTADARRLLRDAARYRSGLARALARGAGDT
ncbi:MAG: hypothetical protein KBD01_14495 [Acidobacteria bacterium]|nr:hypothetical protein [Acidobacteriota bacterium]